MKGWVLLLVVSSGCMQAATPAQEGPEPWEGICEHLNHIQDRPLVVMEVPEKPERYEDTKYFIQVSMWPWDANEEENEGENERPDAAACTAFPADEERKYSTMARILPYDHCYAKTSPEYPLSPFTLGEDEVRLFPREAWRSWGAVCVEKDPPANGST